MKKILKESSISNEVLQQISCWLANEYGMGLKKLCILLAMTVLFFSLALVERGDRWYEAIPASITVTAVGVSLFFVLARNWPTVNRKK